MNPFIPDTFSPFFPPDYQPGPASYAGQPPATVIKPDRLRPGDTIGLFCPAAPAYSQETVKIAQESLQALGFQTKPGPHIYDRYGYLAGRDADWASELHAFFNDRSVKAVMAIHGGWGCARLLPLLIMT